MQPQKCWRIDLGELKALIVKKLGSNKSKQYFYYLNRFLSKKLRKDEFDKLCFRVLGRENIELHNQFIQSILKNACQAKTPPPIPVSNHSNSNSAAANSSIREDGYEQRGGILPNHNQCAWSNGFVQPPSRKNRSMAHDQKLKDRPNALGPNEKVDYVSKKSTNVEDSGNKVVVNNGSIIPCDYHRPLQYLQSVAAELPENNLEGPAQRPGENARINIESRTKECQQVGEEAKLKYFQRPLTSPLGIPVWSSGMGGPCTSMSVRNTVDFPGYFDTGELSDAENLKKRMELIATSESMGGVSMECANVLNNVLDIHLKRLIRSCVELVGARSTCQSRRNPSHKEQMQGKPINGIWPNNHLHMQHGSGPAVVMQEQKSQYSISLLDFKVAMELNPRQLGGDWPLQLEKICMHPVEQ